ncbi:MAG: hypothetical protein HZC28_11700 [Spirochaetes bacterium]|nr:hypothetical protein [Spirochaetota bacterium]
MSMHMYAQTPVFTENFENAELVAKNWKDGTYTLEKTDRGTAMCVEQKTPEANKPMYTFDAAAVKGKKIRITAMVKAENVSERPKLWNGIKIMFHWQTPAKKDWPQATVGVGTFGWQRVQFTVDVPSDTTAAYFYLGLESVTGKAWFDDVSIVTSEKAQELSTVIPPAKEDLSGSITVDALRVKGPVNRLIFGHNLEAADGKDIFGAYPSPKGRNGDGVWDPKNRRLVPEVVQFSKDVGMGAIRYPGGCLVHNFDWHKAVGPYEERPDFAFGIDEYIEYCRAVGAEPLMNVAVYVGTAADKADLVEYLNAPATSQHPWAMKRAQWGHKEPYGVKYFEIGNEEDHGNHDVKPRQKWSAEQYAAYYLECVRLMKKVDPTIKMSVHAGTGTPPSDPWNATVFSIVKDKADFIAIHTYLSPDDMYMRSTDVAAARLAEYREVIRKNAGKDIPMAITEFNGGNHEFRYSYGAALFCADYVRHMLEPANNVLMAQYWHFIQGFWGFIRPMGGSYVKLPAYYTFRLWGQHFGTELLEIKTAPPKFEAKIANIIDTPAFNLEEQSTDQYTFRVTGKDAFTVDIHGVKSDQYPEFIAAAVSPMSTYEVSFKARVTGDPENFVLGLGVMDKRGWTATKSAIGIEGIETKRDWYEFKGEYNTLPNATGISILGRLRGTSAAGIKASIEVKDLRVVRKPMKPYDLLTASASRAADGKTLYLIVFNKSALNNITTRIAVNGVSIASGKAWQVNAPELDNKDGGKESARETLSGAAVEGISGGSFNAVLPAHSMTAYELTVK